MDPGKEVSCVSDSMAVSSEGQAMDLGTQLHTDGSQKAAVSSEVVTGRSVLVDWPQQS